MTTYIGIFSNNPNTINYSNNPKLKEVTEFYTYSNFKVFLCTFDNEQIDILYESDTIDGIINQINNDKNEYGKSYDFTQESLKEYIENNICYEDSPYFGALFEGGKPKWFPKEVNLIHLTFTNEE